VTQFPVLFSAVLLPGGWPAGLEEFVTID